MCLIGVNWLRKTVGASWSAIALERLKTPLSLTWWLDSALDRYRWTTRTKATNAVCFSPFFYLMWTSFCFLSLRLRLVPPAGQSVWQNTISWWGKSQLLFLQSPYVTKALLLSYSKLNWYICRCCKCNTIAWEYSYHIALNLPFNKNTMESGFINTTLILK